MIDAVLLARRALLPPAIIAGEYGNGSINHMF
jgi:hypothetical protein